MPHESGCFGAVSGGPSRDVPPGATARSSSLRRVGCATLRPWRDLRASSPFMTTLARSLLCTFLVSGLLLAQRADPAPKEPKPAPAANPHAYVPFREHDLAKVARLDGTPEQRTVTLEGAALHAFVEDLFRHARSYPTSFADDEEKALATREAKALGEVLEVAIGNPDADVDLRVLLDAARLEVCAHNLDVAGAATRARGYFERILAKDAEHAEAHLHFGMHLVGLPGGAKDAVPHLEFARDHGQKVALRGLGLAHVMLGDREKAIAYLRAWAKEFEGDVGTARMIDALEHGAEIGVRTVEGDKAAEKDAKKEPAPKKLPEPENRMLESPESHRAWSGAELLRRRFP